MVNNESNGGPVTRMQSLKAAAHVDINNNEKSYKDRNVPTEYKFNFDSSQKFNYLNVENPSDLQEKDQQENKKPNGTVENVYPTSKGASNVLKPLSMNVTETNVKPKVVAIGQQASHHYAHSNSGAIKRGCEDVENENEDDSVTSISSLMGCSRRSPPKKPKFVVTSEEMNEYFNLLDQNEIQLFLKRDACCLISDKVGAFY